MEVACSVYKSYDFIRIMRGRAEHIVTSSEKFKDASLGIWDSCWSLQMLFFLPLFGLWNAENPQDRTEHFSFFGGKLPAVSVSRHFLPLKNIAWHCLNSSYSCLGAEQWWVAWPGARASSETVTSVFAQAILCNHAPTNPAQNTPVKTKCSSRRILPCGSSPCFLTAFLDHPVTWSDFYMYLNISYFRCPTAFENQDSLI